jgi:hypothetical protein
VRAGDVQGIGHCLSFFDWSLAVGNHVTVQHGLRDLRGGLFWLTIPIEHRESTVQQKFVRLVGAVTVGGTVTRVCTRRL